MNAKIFFLPLETRPGDLAPLPQGFGRFWHTGVIYDGKVYECFSQGKHAITPLDANMTAAWEKPKAVFLNADIDSQTLENEIASGTSCGEYVARVVGLSDGRGDVKRFTPQEVYDYLNNQQARKSDVV